MKKGPKKSRQKSSPLMPTLLPAFLSAHRAHNSILCYQKKDPDAIQGLFVKANARTTEWFNTNVKVVYFPGQQ
jgi:hypothetical protein